MAFRWMAVYLFVTDVYPGFLETPDCLPDSSCPVVSVCPAALLSVPDMETVAIDCLEEDWRKNDSSEDFSEFASLEPFGSALAVWPSVALANYQRRLQPLAVLEVVKARVSASEETAAPVFAT